LTGLGYGWRWMKEREREKENLQKYAIHADDGIKIYFCNRIYSEHDREVKSAEIMR
jgi:hypothetical protein